jgi:hypothetical protein
MTINIKKTLNGFYVTIEDTDQVKEYVWREIDYLHMLEKLAYVMAGEKVSVVRK